MPVAIAFQISGLRLGHGISGISGGFSVEYSPKPRVMRFEVESIHTDLIDSKTDGHRLCAPPSRFGEPSCDRP